MNHAERHILIQKWKLSKIWETWKRNPKRAKPRKEFLAHFVDICKVYLNWTLILKNASIEKSAAIFVMLNIPSLWWNNMLTFARKIQETFKDKQGPEWGEISPRNMKIYPRRMMVCRWYSSEEIEICTSQALWWTFLALFLPVERVPMNNSVVNRDPVFKFFHFLQLETTASHG